MKKFKLLLISLVLSIFVVLTFTACATKTKNTLTFEVAENLTTEVGNYFNVPTCIGEDSNGDIYSPIVKAVDPNGDAVIIEDGKIFIDYLGEYTVTYTLLFDNEYITKTTKVQSKDTSVPNIKLDSDKEYVIVGNEYTIPTPEYEDNYDKVADVTTSVSVKFGENSLTPVDGKITLDQIGEYKVTYTAIDTSGNKNEKVLTVTSFEGEADNVTYFNREFGTNALSVREDVGTITSSKEMALPGEEYSLKFSVGITASNPDNKKGIAGVFLDNPYIKDITIYDYLYFYVYTDSDNVGVSFNGIYSSNRLQKNNWNKIVLTKFVDGDKIDYRTQWGTRMYYDSYRAEIGLDPWVGQPTDITGLLLYLYVPEDKATNTYISTIKGANSLPETTVEFNSVYALEEITLPVASVNGYDNVTQKVFVTNGGVTSEVVGNTYTFENAGTYSFNYQIYSNGALIDVVDRSVLVVEEEKGNLNYFNYSFGADNVSHNGMTGVSTSSNEKTIAGEDYSLKHVNNSYWGASQIMLEKAYQKDITEYKYLYFYVCINKADIGVTFNNVWSADRSLIPGVWNRVVLTRNSDSSNYLTPWGTNVFAETGASPTNMDGFTICLYHPANVDTTIYISAMRGTNEEPTYASLDVNLNVTKGEAFDIPDATVVGATNVTQKVYHVTKGTATEITSDTYTLTENGTHTLAFEVYVDGKLVETLKKTVNIFDKEDGNITYFNQSFGVNSVTATNAVSVGINSEKAIEGETSSLECYLQAPGYWPTITIGNPFLKNLNEKDGSQNYLYNYVYFFAYSTGESTSLNVHVALGITLPKDTWTRLTLVRQGDTFYYNGNCVFGTDTVNVNDISGLQFVFDTTKETQYSSVFLSTLWAVKELPAFELEVNELNFVGSEINVAPTVTEGYTVNAYFNGQPYDVANAFVPQEHGIYTFTYEITKDGKLVDIVTKDIVVTEVENDNLTYFNREFGVKNASGWSTDTTITATKEKTYGNEEYSLKVSAPYPYWGVGGVYINSHIENISSYNYVYFYIYTDVVGAKLHNPTSSSSLSEVNVGVWNRIVLVRQADGSFTSGTGLGITSAQATNMNAGNANTHFGICLYATGGPNPGTFNGVEFYISSVRVTNELPQPESNVVANFSSLLGNNGLATPNAMAYGPTSAIRYQGDECSTELYCQAVGWPTVKLTSPLISNLNAKDENEEYLYNYVTFYVKGQHANTSLMIGNATTGVISNETWTKVVLERVGDTFYIGTNNVFGSGDITASDISNLQILVDTTGVGSWTSVYMSSWIATKTL